MGCYIQRGNQRPPLNTIRHSRDLSPLSSIFSVIKVEVFRQVSPSIFCTLTYNLDVQPIVSRRRGTAFKFSCRKGARIWFPWTAMNLRDFQLRNEENILECGGRHTRRLSWQRWEFRCGFPMLLARNFEALKSARWNFPSGYWYKTRMKSRMSIWVSPQDPLLAHNTSDIRVRI